MTHMAFAELRKSISKQSLLLGILLLICIQQVHSMGCSAADEALLKQRRIESLRANIFAQLRLIDESLESEKNATTPEDEHVRQSYDALLNASIQVEQKACQAQDFYAKPVTSFIGSMTPDLITMDLSRHRRQTGDSGLPSPQVRAGASILSSYTINLEFNLEDHLKDVSRADLLLNQLPTKTGGNIEQRDNQQFIEIRTVLGNFEERHIVEGKYIGISEVGYKVFEITNAVKLWILRNIHGNVTLEVAVYCYSSPDCAKQGTNGKLPAKVEFLYAANDTEHAPRVIIISKNPLENKLSTKSKRSSPNLSPDFCAQDESMCCLKPLTINFWEDLGILSIIHPESFEANYCEGICPQISGLGVMTPQRFEFLRHLGSSHPAASIEPCCAGSTYKSLDVLMRVRNPVTRAYNSQIENLQQVQVTSCRCA